MILPTKRLHQDRALLTVGGEVLRHLDEAKTVSRLWEDVRNSHREHRHASLTFDWFVLALDMLFSINAITISAGRITKHRP